MIALAMIEYINNPIPSLLLLDNSVDLGLSMLRLRQDFCNQIKCKFNKHKSNNIAGVYSGKEIKKAVHPGLLAWQSEHILSVVYELHYMKCEQEKHYRWPTVPVITP